MTDSDDLDGLEDALGTLELSLGETTAMTAAFDAELVRVRDSMMFTSRRAQSLTTSFGAGLKRAFDGVIFDGQKASDALRQVAQSLADATYNTAMKPVQQGVGGALVTGINSLMSGLFGYADGGAFVQGRVMPFAKGGVVTGPTYFPMRGATGLMGEAGPEAILPLARGADGRLGVSASGGGGGGRPVQVVMNIQTPDVAGFRRSRSQVAAEMGRALSLGQRNR